LGLKGAKYLADAIKSNSSLLKIILSENNIGDEGAKYFADAFEDQLYAS
jgi:hypothetical protein